MPSKKKKAATSAGPALPAIPKELIDQFVKGPMTAEAVAMASAAFKKVLIERVLGAELSHHQGYAPGAERPVEVSNQCNGVTGKSVLTDDGPLLSPARAAGGMQPLADTRFRRIIERRCARMLPPCSSPAISTAQRRTGFRSAPRKAFRNTLSSWPMARGTRSGTIALPIFTNASCAPGSVRGLDGKSCPAVPWPAFRTRVE